MGTVLDTSVILEKPQALLEYDNVVVLYNILQELDDKKHHKRLGYKAREATRIIIENDLTVLESPYHNSKRSIDDIVIADSLKHNYQLVTMDSLMYLKAKSKSINVELYEPDGQVYNGISEEWINKDTKDQLNNQGKVKTKLDLYEHQFVDLGDTIARYFDGYLHKISWNKRVNGIERPNKEQVMALDVLFDNKVKLVSMFGQQGTGKSTLAINSAIDQVKNGSYQRILVSRPKKQRGFDEEKLGYLTGDMKQKMLPFIAPLEDNLYSQTAIDFEVVPLSMIQGRSFDNAIWIITECQDIRKENIDLIVSRAGQNTKIIAEGDLDQNSDRNLDRYNNGLTHIINKLKESDITATIELDKIERSKLAKLANDLK